MRMPYDLWISNLVTGETEIIHDYYLITRSDVSDFLKCGSLYIHLKPYLVKEIPFKLEFHYK